MGYGIRRLKQFIDLGIPPIHCKVQVKSRIRRHTKQILQDAHNIYLAARVMRNLEYARLKVAVHLFDALSIALNCQSFVEPGRTALAPSLKGALPHASAASLLFPERSRYSLRPLITLSS